MLEGTVAAIASAIRSRRLSPVEATEECLTRIRRLDDRLRAFITVNADGALQTARTLEAEAAAGRFRGPLHGVPLAFKDLCHISGQPTSCGTKTVDYFVSPRDCEAARRLIAAGAVNLGKLNMSEIASGPFGDNPHHGDAQNPWRLGHCAGGSSSGSGAAVAAGLAAGALGTDTGGSIRLPAGCCGVVGLKPTYGRVSRAGAMPLSWSLDHIGPLTLTVLDAAILLREMAGHDPYDATSSHHPVADYAAGLDEPIAGLRVGVPANYFFDGVDPEMEAGVRAAIDALARLGARVTEITLPDPQALTDAANVIARPEAASVHARLITERPHEVGPAVRARTEQGLRVLAHDYLAGLRVRAQLTREFITQVFDAVDVLVAPVIPEPAPALDVVKSGTVADIVGRMGRFSRLTRPINALGLPALAVPCGFSGAELPLAVQIVGRPFDESTVLRVGHAYEQATEWHRRRPPLAS
ncbi:MAG TPA: amidase [Candidatus Limnocylindrales bacterium]|nr:amidase [Candidatus Limnocylindrales bacterium]